jgi:hypothetical protein
MTINFKRTIKIVIGVSDDEQTKRLVDILASLVEDPGGEKKKEISDKLDKIIEDVKSTIS